MTIAMILNAKGRDVVTLPHDARVADAVALLAERGIGAMPVMDGDAVVGVFSERDVIRILSDRGEGALGVPISTVMTAPALTVDCDEPVLGALSVMTRRRVRHLPVVDAGRLVGLVSIGDLVKYRIDRIEAEAAALRDYIQQA